MRQAGTRLGVIDVGTNAIHLHIVELAPGGHARWRLTRRELPRLGGGGLVRGRLTAASMARALAVLRRYVVLLARHRVTQIEAVATSAARDAINGPAFVRRVRRELGLPLRIISGREEARLIFLGTLFVHRFRQPTAIISIGGGSTQVMCGDARGPQHLASVPLGGARLAQRFLHHDPPLSGELHAMDTYVRRAWQPVVRALRRQAWRRAWGSSTTIDQLNLAAWWQTHRHPPAVTRPRWLTRAALRRLINQAASSTAAQRKRRPGVDPRREDMIVPTGVVLLAWMELCAIARIRFAPGSLREGLVWEAVHDRRRRLH